MKSRILPVVFTAAVTSLATLFVAGRFSKPVPYFAEAPTKQKTPVNYASFDGSLAAKQAPADFEMAAEGSVKAVVHIKTETSARLVPADDVFGRMFGQQYYIPQQMGSGSGVVISADGYIVTNNHVVANADKVTVTFNDRFTTVAKVISKDPATDIAVLKVNEKNLAYMEFGNSDNVKLGQWVLAVGYPLTLDATVTAGIVSAKGRSLGINKRQSSTSIESFIQTDAAVNPGNSGGALVNTAGQLIGINSAIASPTGSYAGYSYAIPSNLVRKVVNDLVQYGSVKRGYLGVEFIDLKTMKPEDMTTLGIDRKEGIYVNRVLPGSGAEKAGLSKGDFITEVNGNQVNTYPELQEQIARFHPGDNISIAYVRNNKENTATVQLGEGDNMLARNLGASLRPLNNDEKKRYNTSAGVAVISPGRGALAKARIPSGFVITAINDKPMKTVEDVQNSLSNTNSAQIAGFMPGRQGMYYFNIEGFDENLNNEQ